MPALQVKRIGALNYATNAAPLKSPDFGHLTKVDVVEASCLPTADRLHARRHFFAATDLTSTTRRRRRPIAGRAIFEFIGRSVRKTVQRRVAALEENERVHCIAPADARFEVT
jgi:hypothetical protein